MKIKKILKYIIIILIIVFLFQYFFNCKCIDNFKTSRNGIRIIEYNDNIIHRDYGTIRYQHGSMCVINSVIESIEGEYWIQTQEVFKPSIQQIIDCIVTIPNYKGTEYPIGNPYLDNIEKWITDFYIDSNRKIYSEDDYPEIPSCLTERCRDDDDLLNDYITAGDDEPPWTCLDIKLNDLCDYMNDQNIRDICCYSCNRNTCSNNNNCNQYEICENIETTSGNKNLCKKNDNVSIISDDDQLNWRYRGVTYNPDKIIYSSESEKDNNYLKDELITNICNPNNVDCIEHTNRYNEKSTYSHNNRCVQNCSNIDNLNYNITIESITRVNGTDTDMLEALKEHILLVGINYSDNEFLNLQNNNCYFTFEENENLLRYMCEGTSLFKKSDYYSKNQVEPKNASGNLCYTNNHMVIIIGSIKHDNKYFWKVRNSWGSNWGDNGHFYVERDVNDERFNGQSSLFSINSDVHYLTLNIETPLEINKYV